MELAGDEKRIQALFRELKLADQRVAPGFDRLWNRAQARGSQPRRAFKTSFAVFTTLLVVTLSAFVFWSRNWQQRQPETSGVAGGSTTNASTLSPAVPEPRRLFLDRATDRITFNRSSRPLVTRPQAKLTRNSVIREAVAISSWQSPTAKLMHSPADVLWTSLPRLDRSVTELKTFLANSSR
jgi:hypothetical protein